MEDLYLVILKYLKENTTDHNSIDIITPFANRLNTMEERSAFVRIIKQLKKDDHILIGSEYTMLSSSLGGVLTSLTSLNVRASITRKGMDYIKELDKPPPYHIENSQNTVIGSGSIQSSSAKFITNNNANAIPDKKMAKYKNMGMMKWFWTLVGSVIASAIIYWLTKK